MAIGTHFIVYERAVGAGWWDGGAAIGKWRYEEAGHNSMVPGRGIWWHHGHTVTHSPTYATPWRRVDTAKCYIIIKREVRTVQGQDEDVGPEHQLQCMELLPHLTSPAAHISGLRKHFQQFGKWMKHLKLNRIYDKLALL